MGDDKPKKRGSYPLHACSMCVAPHLVVGLVAPQVDGLTGHSSTRDRPVPAPFTRQIGPLVGHGRDGLAAHLDASSQWEGTLLLGQAGSGKTWALLSMFAWCLADHVRPSGRSGWPGDRHAIFAFESKGEGVVEYVKWGEALGAVGASKVRVVDLADDSTPAIDMMVGADRDPQAAAALFVDAMASAFSDGSIQYRSQETLRQVIGAGLVVSDEMARAAALPSGGSFLDYAHVLLGGRGDDAAVALAGEVRAAAQAQGASRHVRAAATGLAPLFDASVSARRQVCEAPRNKVDLLLKRRGFFAPSRRRVSFDEALESHSVVVINMGTSANGEVVSGELAQVMSSMLLFLLKNAIERKCSSWRADGRSVSIFSDELSVLSGASPVELEWLRNQGRSYGVRLFLATQYAEQLDSRLRTAVLGFGTLVVLAQRNPVVAQALADDLGVGGQQWSAQDIVNLGKYTAIVRSSVDGQVQPPFTVVLDDFASDKASFRQRQGIQ